MASDLIERLQAPAVFNPREPNYETYDLTMEAADALAAQAAEIERLTKERDLEKAVAAAAVEDAVAMCRERAKLVQRIRNQRAALRQNWEIVEKRQNYLGSVAARQGWALQRDLKLQAEARADALAARVAELEAALNEIRRLDQIDIGIDPTWPRRIAKAALHPKDPAPAGDDSVTLQQEGPTT